MITLNNYSSNPDLEFYLDLIKLLNGNESAEVEMILSGYSRNLYSSRARFNKKPTNIIIKISKRNNYEYKFEFFYKKKLKKVFTEDVIVLVDTSTSIKFISIKKSPTLLIYWKRDIIISSLDSKQECINFYNNKVEELIKVLLDFERNLKKLLIN